MGSPPPEPGSGSALAEATTPLRIRPPGGLDAGGCLLLFVLMLFGSVPLIFLIKALPIGEATKAKVFLGAMPVLLLLGTRILSWWARRSGGSLLDFQPASGQVFVDGRLYAPFTDLEAAFIIEEEGGCRLALSFFARSTVLSYLRPREVMQVAHRRVLAMAAHQGVEVSDAPADR